jgi:hypothetical protein
MRAWAFALTFLAVFCARSAAYANGRFPAADWVIAGPGLRRVVLRTTFGLVLSDDGGRSWGWICEGALSRSADITPPVVIGGDGLMVAGVPAGITTSMTGCDWLPPRVAPTSRAIDLAQDATGRVMVVAVSDAMGDRVEFSEDHGRTWTPGAQRAGLILETVEVAPGMPSRVYASGYLGGDPVVFRSDDGGRTAREMTRDFGGLLSVWVSGVDPTNADVVYLRSTDTTGTWLLRSDDGGARFQRVTQTMGDMKGFALSDDGQTVWIGSSRRAEGLQRSVRGAPFTRVGAEVSVRCLRQRQGVLFVCADDTDDGYALGCSINGGERIEPLLALHDLPGPLRCAAGTQVTTQCAPAWPALQMTLSTVGTALDASPPHDLGAEASATDATDVSDTDARMDAPDAVTDAPVDLGFDATEVATADVPLDREDAAQGLDAAPPQDVRDVSASDQPDARVIPPPPRTGCDCRVPKSKGPSPAGDWCGPVLGALVGINRRRAQRQPSTP